MKNVIKIVAIVQARMGSTRLPGKVMKRINGIPIIELLLLRLTRSKKIDQIVIATTTNPCDDVLTKYLLDKGYYCVSGSEKDVLDRYYKTACSYAADVIVRITGDCPLVDSEMVDTCIENFLKNDVDYLCNNYPPTYPDGLDIEIFRMSALEQAFYNAKIIFEREHVTPYLRIPGKFKTQTLYSETDYSAMRWTVDEASDLEVVNNIFNHFQPDIYFSWKEVLVFQENNPQLFERNSTIVRNQGATMNTGQKLWSRAKQVIPGGTMLLSKRPEMFLPNQWPTYFSRAKGCKVWDLDDNEYIDMSIMGIGTNTLGYGNDEVDDAVRNVVDTGNMSTFNCPEEVYLAEKLVELHPWSDMVRFARSGGEANAIAIRIARASSGKDKVAVCGYHGWHDWYLSVNLAQNDGLNGHLLPGLEPNGVPESLIETVFPFKYNNYAELESLVTANDIGVIIMEVVRNSEPQDNFLQKVRKLATDKGIVLIFDECTSGFRETFGGLHKKYGVEPDLAMFGKALGNGYSITAVIGRREIMESAQSSFISSTFWTERIGPTAALKTLEVMAKIKSWEQITYTGLKISAGWQRLADKYELKIEHWGMPALAGFTFQGPHALSYKTLLTQEMLAKGYLATNTVYSCIEHTPEIVNEFMDNLDSVFRLIKECELGRDISTLLKGPICHGGFKRLN